MHPFSFRAFPLLAGAALLALTACEPTLDDAPTVSTGTVDFSRYVAFGDDYTAGFANGGLSRASQQAAYPAILAGQFSLVNGSRAFTSPLLPENVTTGGVRLATLLSNNLPLLTSVGPSVVVDSLLVSGTNPCDARRYQYPRWDGTATGLPQNLGIPGLPTTKYNVAGIGNEANQATATVGAYNAYLERLLPAGDDRTYIQLAHDANPTFFTAFVGLNDVMTFLRSGGTCGTLPQASAIATQLNALLDTLPATSKGLLATVPSPLSMPAFRNRVSDVNRRLGRPDTARMFVQTPAGAVVETQFNDFILLAAANRVGRLETATGEPATAALGSRANPLRDQDVLTNTQVNTVNSLFANLTIALKSRIARENGRIALVESSLLFSNIAEGLQIDGVSYGPDPVTGGVFTYDGFSLSPRGQAILANAFIRTINANFGASLPQVEVANYPATPLPEASRPHLT